MKGKISKNEQIKILENKLNIYESSSLSNLYYSKKQIDSLGENNFMASGLIFKIQNLSGEIVAHFCIDDGLSQSTIECIKNDIEKTMQKKAIYIKKG